MKRSRDETTKKNCKTSRFCPNTVRWSDIRSTAKPLRTVAVLNDSPATVARTAKYEERPSRGARVRGKENTAKLWPLQSAPAATASIARGHRRVGVGNSHR